MIAFSRLAPQLALCVLAGTFAWAPTAGAQVPELPSEADSAQTSRWVDFDNGLRERSIQALIGDPSDPLRYYAASERHLYRSLDGGNTWRVVLSLTLRSADDRPGEDEALTQERVDSLTEEQIEAINERFIELSQELFDEVAADSDETTAALVVESEQDDLLLDAVDEVTGGDSIVEAEDVEDVAPTVRGFTHIEVDPDEPSRVFASSSVGLYRSADYGATWSRVFRGSGERSRVLSALSVTSGVVLVGSGDGVRRSLDGGDTWEAAPAPPGRTSIQWIESAPSRPETLYLSADGQFHRSDDGGLNWAIRGVPQGVRQIESFAVDSADPDTLYLATDQGVLRSDNGGVSFNRLGTVGLREQHVLWLRVDSLRIVAGTRNSLYVSTNGGVSWGAYDNGLTASTVRRITSGAGRVLIATDFGIFGLMARSELGRATLTIREVRDQWADEPNLGQVIEAALRHASLDGSNVADWNRRIWWSRFVPEMQVRYYQYSERTENRDSVVAESGALRPSAFDVFRGDEEEWRVMFTWDLFDLADGGRLSRSEVATGNITGGGQVSLVAVESTSAEGERFVVQRTDLVQRVVRVYQARREVMLRGAEREASTLQRRVTEELEFRELTARLDLLTGGFFTRYSSIR